jgi:hypothetical protein
LKTAFKYTAYELITKNKKTIREMDSTKHEYTSLNKEKNHLNMKVSNLKLNFARCLLFRLLKLIGDDYRLEVDPNHRIRKSELAYSALELRGQVENVAKNLYI